MDFTYLLIFGLATWRVANMLVHERGPFQMFFRLRVRVGIGMDNDGEPVMIPDRFFAELLSCVFCSSIWIAAGWVLFWIFLPVFSLKIATVFALSALAIVINRYVKG